jgi:membrane fusion protein (multidrug efflux system)
MNNLSNVLEPTTAPASEVHHPELVEGSVPTPLEKTGRTDSSASLGLTKATPFRALQNFLKGFVQKHRRESLIGAAVLVALIAGGAYLIYASYHQTTDDAYTTGHVHSISTRVSGTVIEVAVDDNERVKKGQVLVRLDPRDFQVVVDKTQADYDRALADFKREEQLLKSGAVSQQEYDEMKAALGVAKANLDDAKNQLSYSTIVAPEDGIVGNKTVETGNRLAQGTVLMSVVQEVWVVANYKETQAGEITPGQQVAIHIDEIPGHTFTGYVDSLSPGSGSTFALLPPENATGNFTKIVQRVPVKIRFDAASVRGFEERLVPGLSVETDVELASTHLAPKNLTGEQVSLR